MPKQAEGVNGVLHQIFDPSDGVPSTGHAVLHPKLGRACSSKGVESSFCLGLPSYFNAYRQLRLTRTTLQHKPSLRLKAQG